MALIVIKDTLNISGVLSILVMQDCVPETAYYAHDAGGDSFALHDKRCRLYSIFYERG